MTSARHLVAWTLLLAYGAVAATGQGLHALLACRDGTACCEPSRGEHIHGEHTPHANANATCCSAHHEHVDDCHSPAPEEDREHAPEHDPDTCAVCQIHGLAPLLPPALPLATDCGQVGQAIACCEFFLPQSNPSPYDCRGPPTGPKASVLA